MLTTASSGLAATDRSAPARPISPRWALAALALSMLLASLGTGIANVALPSLAQAFAASFRSVQWVVLAYLLAVTTLVVSVGRLGDLAGRRRLLLAGIALFTAASIACGGAPTLGWLVAARAVQGAGAAVLMALSLAFVAEVAPRENIGGAMGLLGTMSAIGTALGPSLGGVLIAAAGWRAIFLVQVPLGIGAWLLARRHLPASPPHVATGRSGFDLPGTLLLALTLGAYALAMTLGRGRPGRWNLALLLAAAAGGVLFVRAERRAAAPLLHLETLRDATLRGALGASALVSTVIMSTMVVGPYYLASGLGLAPPLAGALLAVGPVVAALAAGPAGRAVDRFGAGSTTALGLVGMAVGAAALALLPAALGLSGWVAPIVLLTSGYALFQTANNTGVLSAIGADRRGVISGLLNLARNLGLVTGASLMGALYTLGSGTDDIARTAPEAAARGMRSTFAVAALLVLFALAATAVYPSRARGIRTSRPATSPLPRRTP